MTTPSTLREDLRMRRLHTMQARRRSREPQRATSAERYHREHSDSMRQTVYRLTAQIERLTTAVTEVVWGGKPIRTKAD